MCRTQNVLAGRQLQARKRKHDYFPEAQLCRAVSICTQAVEELLLGLCRTGTSGGIS